MRWRKKWPRHEAKQELATGNRQSIFVGVPSHHPRSDSYFWSRKLIFYSLSSSSHARETSCTFYSTIIIKIIIKIPYGIHSCLGALCHDKSLVRGPLTSFHFLSYPPRRTRPINESEACTHAERFAIDF